MVLGLAESWGELSPQTVVGLQAELERLGVPLLLISSGELVCVRPGRLRDGLVRSSRVRQLWPSGLGPWHRAPAVNAETGPGCVSARRSPATLALIDEQGIVRWLWRSAQGAGSLERLRVALGLSRLQLPERQRLASGARQLDVPAFSRGELMASLLSAFTATFRGEEAPRQASARAQQY